MFDMNCQRLRQHTENSPDGAFFLDHLSAEILAHIEGCFECKDFVQQRRELALGLLRIREASPEVPQSLNAAVLTAFRQHVTIPRREHKPLPKRGRVAIYSSSAALLVAAAVVAFLVLPGKKVAPNIQTLEAQQQIAVIPASKSDSQVQIKEVTAHKQVIKKSSPPPAISHDQSSFPSGFSSLMYCDQLSCAGDMEIVRVQLSPAMLGLPAIRTDAPGTIVADVLVGPDGIARGIRLEQ
jgi:hypothetical protein